MQTKPHLYNTAHDIIRTIALQKSTDNVARPLFWKKLKYSRHHHHYFIIICTHHSY